MSVASPSRAAFPGSQAGRHPRLHFRGLLRLHSNYRPLDRSTAQGGLCHRASIHPVTRTNRLPATRSNRQLSGWFLPPLVIRAFWAHCDAAGSRPSDSAPRHSPSPHPSARATRYRKPPCGRHRPRPGQRSAAPVRSSRAAARASDASVNPPDPGLDRHPGQTEVAAGGAGVEPSTSRCRLRIAIAGTRQNRSFGAKFRPSRNRLSFYDRDSIKLMKSARSWHV